MTTAMTNRHVKLFDAATRADDVLELSDLHALVDRTAKAANLDEITVKSLKHSYGQVFSELSGRSDGASRLTRQQFTEAMNAAVMAAVAEYPAMDSPSMTAFKSLATATFTALDANHNGQVTSDEFVRFAAAVDPRYGEAEAVGQYAEMTRHSGTIKTEDAINIAWMFLSSPDTGYTPGGVFVHLSMN